VSPSVDIYLLQLILRFLQDTRRHRSVIALQREACIEHSAETTNHTSLRGLLETAVAHVQHLCANVHRTLTNDSRPQLEQEQSEQSVDQLRNEVITAQQCIEQQQNEIITLRDKLHTTQFELMMLKMQLPGQIFAKTGGSVFHDRAPVEEHTPQASSPQSPPTPSTQPSQASQPSQLQSLASPPPSQSASPPSPPSPPTDTQPLPSHDTHVQELFAGLEFRSRAAFQSTPEDTFEFEFAFAEHTSIEDVQPSSPAIVDDIDIKEKIDQEHTVIELELL